MTHIDFLLLFLSEFAYSQQDLPSVQEHFL